MSMGKKSPDGFRRVVIWQPLTGYAADLDGRKMLRHSTPARNVQWFDGGDGSEHPERIESVFEIETPDNDIINHLREMALMKCPVRLVALDWNKALTWFDPTVMNLLPQRPGFGQFAGERLRIRNDNFYAQIFDSTNILAGFPWALTEGKLIESTTDYRLVIPDEDEEAEYTWVVKSPGSVPSVSNAGLLETNGSVELIFEFPVGLSKWEWNYTGWAAQGLLKALDWDGLTIGSYGPGQAFTLPRNTYFIKVEFTGPVAISQPELTLVDAGPMLQLRKGWLVNCGDYIETPPWAKNTPPVLLLEDVTLSLALTVPYCGSEDVYIRGQNTPPYYAWEDEVLKVTKWNVVEIPVGEGGNNTPPYCGSEEVQAKGLASQTPPELQLQDVTLTVSTPNQPPDISVMYSSANVAPGDTVTLEHTATDPEGQMGAMMLVFETLSFLPLEVDWYGWNGSTWVWIGGVVAPTTNQIMNTVTGYAQKKATVKLGVPAATPPGNTYTYEVLAYDTNNAMDQLTITITVV